jgi:hypothetical protein
MGLIISIPIAIIYNLMISKLSNMITKDYGQKERIQRDLLISIICGILGIAIGYYVFGSEKMENKIVKYGLMLGGSILLVYSAVYNWNTLEDLTKLLFLLGTLIFIIMFSYNYANTKIEIKPNFFKKNRRKSN